MAKLEAPESVIQLPLAVVKNMIMLATSGFGVVVALAWNEAIKASVEKYIDPYLGKNSGMISLFIYAVAMTVLSVLVTMQLSKLEKKLTGIRKKKEPEVIKKSNFKKFPLKLKESKKKVTA